MQSRKGYFQVFVLELGKQSIMQTVDLVKHLFQA